MEGQVLESVNNNPYLGVELSSTLLWDTHIGNILTKANTSGIYTAKYRQMSQAYLSLVRPHLEYTSSVWDLHLQKHIYQIEMVQRRAARFIKHEYSRDSGIVTSIMQDLELQALPRKAQNITPASLPQNNPPEGSHTITTIFTKTY